MSRIDIQRQAGAIRSYFPDGSLTSSKKQLIWIGTIKPSPWSSTYKIKLEYSYKDGVNVYVLDPKPLLLASGKDRLPHVYSHEKQKICLYYPDRTEWNSSKYLVHTIFPWISEWLCHYELWVITGIWHGGGKHIEVETKDQEEAEKDNLKREETLLD